MPATSQSQRGLIFSKRDQYGSKEKTPKKWKWIWDEDWENKGKLPKKVSENYRAKTVNEYGSMGGYPLGAADDSRAPWNEKEDDSDFDLELRNNEIIITRRYNYSAEDEWDEDQAYIDPESFDLFAAEALEISAEEKWEAEDYLEIQNIEDLPGDNFKFITSWGTFEADMDELIDLTNLF